jgi:hypothetical protein
MKYQNFFAGLLIGILVGLAVASLLSRNDRSAVKKYEICKVDFMSGGKNFCAVRIDTTTGKSWALSLTGAHWMEIPEAATEPALNSNRQ